MTDHRKQVILKYRNVEEEYAFVKPENNNELREEYEDICNADKTHNLIPKILSRYGARYLFMFSKGEERPTEVILDENAKGEVLVGPSTYPLFYSSTKTFKFSMEGAKGADKDIDYKVLKWINVEPGIVVTYETLYDLFIMSHDLIDKEEDLMDGGEFEVSGEETEDSFIFHYVWHED